MISEFTHAQLAQLCKKGIVQISMFDEKEIIQIIDPNHPGIKYILRKNQAIRETLIKKTEAKLEKTSNLKTQQMMLLQAFEFEK